MDWYSSLKIASSAADIARFESTRSVYLPEGHVPMGHWAGSPPVISLKGLANTLTQLAEQGPASFYQGDLAARVLADTADRSALFYLPRISPRIGCTLRN